MLLFLLGSLNVWGTDASVGDVLWGETWTGATTATSGSNTAKASANCSTTKGTTMWGGATITYSESANTVYVRNDALAKGTAPELMFTSGKTWTISGIPTGNATEMTLTFKSNNSKASVTCTTADVTCTGSITGNSTSGYVGTFTIGNSEAKASTITLQFSNSGNTRIDDIQLVVKTAATGGGDIIVKTLKSIAVDGMTKNYEVGDAFSFDGTCTATYSVTKNDVPQADEEKIVTPTSVSTPDMAVAGEKTITVTYTEDEVEKSTTYNITVAAALPKITIDGTATGITADDETQNITVGGVAFGGIFKQYSTSNLWLTSGTGFIYNKESFGKIRKITINYKSGGSGTSYQWIKLGDAVMDSYEAASTNGVKYETSTGGSSNTFVVTGDYEYFCLSISNKNLQASSIVISYEADPTAPSVTVDPTEVNATAEAVNGSIDVTYTNIATASATVGLFNDAECNETFTDGWLTASLNGVKDIAYTLTENTGAARTAYIKLTAPASNGTSPDVVKIIAVTQAKGIPTYTALNAIFEAATSSEQTVKVAFNNWVISAVNGANAYLTDGTYGLIIYQSDHGFSAGDVLSGTAQATLVLYKGSAELKSLTATTDGLTVTPGGTISARVLDAEGAAALTGANAGSLIKISGECTETTGRYYINGIQLYNTLYSFETPTVGDVYDCTGIFVMYNSYKEILPRQNGDLVPSAVTPTAVITFEDFSIEKGQNTTLAATVAPAVAASAEVTYSIVDGGEYVSREGDVLTANEIGIAHIRATVADNLPNYYGATKDITVTVTAPDSRKTAVIDGITAVSGTLVTETAGSHKDKEYISYAALKGNAANAPAIPSGKSFVRIYQNGGYLAINAVKGCLIDEVIVSIPSDCNPTTIAVGTDEENLPTTGGSSATAGNNFSTGTGLNSQNVYLVCLGTDKNHRLEVGAITVKYNGDPISVKSIALSGEYQTEFTKNATFNHDGVVVTATYTDDSQADVTTLAEFSDPDMSTIGPKEITVSYGGKSTSYNIEVVAATLTEIALSGSYPTRFNMGDAFSHAGMTVTATYSDFSEEDVTASAIFSGYDMSVAGAQTVTVEFGGQSAEYQIIVVPENTDVLTADLIGVEGTSYVDWSDKTGFGTSSVYAGNSTNGSGANAGAIQLRYNASEEAKQAGIILTGSNGMVLKGFSVTVKSGSNTLNVYGKNTAYTSRLDLYSEDEATRGKLIGTVSATGALTLEEGVSYDDNYQYIGMRSNSGALYLSSIMITWGDATPEYKTVRSGLTAGNYYTICYNKKMTAIKGATLWSFIGKDASFAYLEEASAPFAAGKPYILYAESGKLEAVLEGDAVGASAIVANGAIHGTFADMDQAALTGAGDNIYLVIGNQLRRVDGQTGNSLPAYRAYVDLDEIKGGAPSSMPGRKVRSMPMQGQTATGMDELNASETPVKMLINGQLFILRGEKMYDAKGQLVK